MPELDELQGLFANLDRHATQAHLADPQDLRSVGDHRARTRTAFVLAGVALLAVVVLGGGWALAGQHGPSRKVVTPGSPTPVSASPGATASAAPTPSATTASPSGSTTCPLTSLGAPDVHVGAASGTTSNTVTIRNIGTTSCQLAAPKLWGATGPDPVALLAQQADSPTAITLGPGELAQLSVFVSNGGGYATDSPQCAHPVTYHDVTVDYGGPQRYVTPVQLSNPCGDTPRVTGWTQLPHLCTPTDLGGQGALGTPPAGAVAALVVTSHGSDACTLPEKVTLTAHSGGGTVTAVQDGGRPGTVLAPGSNAQAVIYPNVSCSTPTQLTSLKLTLPDGDLPVPGSVTACTGVDLFDWTTG